MSDTTYMSDATYMSGNVTNPALSTGVLGILV